MIDVASVDTHRGSAYFAGLFVAWSLARCTVDGYSNIPRRMNDRTVRAGMPITKAAGFGPFQPWNQTARRWSAILETCSTVRMRFMGPPSLLRYPHFVRHPNPHAYRTLMQTFRGVRGEQPYLSDQYLHGDAVVPIPLIQFAAFR